MACSEILPDEPVKLILVWVIMYIQTSPYPFWLKVGPASPPNLAQVCKTSAMADKPAQEQKRKASSSLRALAQELQIVETRRNYDMSKAQFSSLLENVEGLCSTPDQRRRAEEAKAPH